MLDLHTSILDHRQPGLLGFFCGCVVADAQLQPQYFSSNGDGFFGDGRDILCPAKDIHDLDLFSCLFRLCQCGIDTLTQQCLTGVARVDGNNVVALGLQVDSNEMAGAIGVSRNPDNGNMPVLL